MTATEVLVVLALVGVAGGFVGGIGGPGGIPVIVALNLLTALSSTAVAATTSSVFVVATVTATALYLHSDGVDWRLAATVGLPALAGTHVGTRVAAGLSAARFERLLGVTLLLAAAGILYRQRRAAESQTDRWRTRPVRGLLAAGSLVVGILAGITGIGGPALTVPLMLVLGVPPVTAIGAGLASGVLITVNSTLGHAIQGTPPALLPAAVVGVPYVLAQVLGWRYVHAVSERTVAYSLAVLALVTVAVLVY